MNRKTKLIIGVIVILALIGGVYMLTRNTNNQDDMSSMNHGNSHTSDSSNESATYNEFVALKGEKYDRMFLASMIAHHQGAVDMANLALNQAKHSELKTMAQDIVSAQNKEIDDMESWQKNWGYPASSGDSMMDHSAMGMEEDMTAMTEQLESLSGDAFDKKFIELMIEHHQSAIDMARPAATNAQHEEIKILAQAIITAQNQEIGQMKAWQKDWGY